MRHYQHRSVLALETDFFDVVLPKGKQIIEVSFGEPIQPYTKKNFYSMLAIWADYFSKESLITSTIINYSL